MFKPIVKNFGDILFHLHRKLGRFAIKHSKDPRPSSAPYLSGDTFRSLADHIFEPDRGLDPALVKERDVVFVESSLIDTFFENIHPAISSPYILITHNSDQNIGKKEVAYMDEKIIHWFAQNNTFAHPKITPLPIGLENLYHYHNGITSLFNNIHKQKYSQKKPILYGFNVLTNQTTRQPALEILEKTPLAERLAGWPTPPKYLRTLAGYRFIASPEGNGLDCHRTWEALYLGVIPIVTKSVAALYFRNLGLPIWIIDDWTDLENLSADRLQDKYIELKTDTSSRALTINYWQKAIKNYA